MNNQTLQSIQTSDSIKSESEIEKRVECLEIVDTSLQEVTQLIHETESNFQFEEMSSLDISDYQPNYEMESSESLSIESFLSLDSSMTSIPSLECFEDLSDSDISFSSISMISGDINETIRTDPQCSSPERKECSAVHVPSEPTFKDREIGSYEIKSSDLRKLVSPQFQLNDIFPNLYQQNWVNLSIDPKSSEHKVSDTQNILPKFVAIPQETICAFFTSDTPKNMSKESNTSNTEDSSEKDSDVLKTIDQIIDNSESDISSEESPAITESIKSEELEQLINDIYFDMCPLKKEKILSDLNTTEAERPRIAEEQHIEDLINTVYFDYSELQKIQILEGLKEPKNERQQNKDVDNIEELINNLYSGYTMSRSANEVKGTPESSASLELMINFDELEKRFRDSIASDTTLQNEVKVQTNEESIDENNLVPFETITSEEHTSGTTAPITETALIEGKWKAAEDPIEPRPAKRNPNWNGKGVDPNAIYRTKEYNGQ